VKNPTPQNIQQTLLFLRRLILLAGGGCLVGVLLLVALVPIDERVSATGKIRAESDSYLFAHRDGLLDRVYVHEGEIVEAGQAVLGLDDSAERQRLKMLEAALAKAESNLALERLSLERTLKLPLPRDFWHMEEDLAIVEERLRHAEVEFGRANTLHSKGLISEQELERSRLAVEVSRAEVTKTSEKLSVLEQGLESSILDEAKARIAGSIAAVHQLKVEKDIILENIEKSILRSPTHGVVTHLPVKRPGQKVAKGDDLAHIAHGDPVWVDLYAGENQVHRIRLGQKVIMDPLAFDTLRHGYIEGTIQRVPLEPERRVLDNDVEAGEFRIQARIDQTPMELKLGTSVRAKIILQRIPLWKLLLPEPMRGGTEEALSGSSPAVIGSAPQ
jgi:multidrug resistance efflux pump